MAAPTIQIKRGIFTNLPALKAGEPGFTTDKYDLYVGLDGTLGNNKFFGSHRYWTKETATVGSSVKIVEATNNGSNFIALKSPDTLAQDTTYTFPATPSAGFVLQTDGSGVLSWVSAAVAAGSITGITVRDEGSTVGTAASITSLNFAGEGITATAAVAGTAATITVNAASSTVAGVSSYNSSDFYFANTYQVGITTATASTKGIAAFNSTDFYITAGTVGINTESIQDMAGSAITAGINTNITVTYDDVNNKINHNVNTATSTVLGVASFSSTNFTVTAGAVSIANNAVGLGTQTYGQYAKSITGGNGLTANASNADDGTDYTIDVATGAGIVITSDAVAFKNAASLSSNTLTKWDSSNSQLTNSTITDNGTTVTIPIGVVTTLSGTNLNYTGFGTFVSLKTTNLYDSTNTNGTSGQFLTVTGTGIGWTTIIGVSNGGISTAARANTVDTATATSGTYYPALLTSSTGVTGAAVNVDAGISYASNTDTLTVQNLTVPGTLTGTATTATKINTTTSTATGYIPFVANGTTTAGESLLVDTGIQYNASTDSLIVANAQLSTVKALDGTAAITIASVTGAVGISSNLTVSGNLFVAGTTTQINTTNLVVEDRVIELGKVQGTAPTDTTWDLGILFNYYTASANKKASVYWEGGVSRFLFASDVSESVLGINLNDTGAVILGTTTPQLTSPVFAPIEVGALWMNDTAGQSVVASYLALNGLYTGAPADRYLQNITVDAGVF